MMVLEGKSRCARALGAATLAALTLLMGACGSDDDGGERANGGGAADAASGAGSGDGSGGGYGGAAPASARNDAAQIRTTFKTYIDSLYSGNYEKACDQATASELHAMRVIGKVPCEVQFRSIFTATPPQQPKPSVTSVKVDGENAIARIDIGDKSRPYRMRMRMVAGVWKIDNSLVTDASRRQAKKEGRL